MSVSYTTLCNPAEAIELISTFPILLTFNSSVQIIGPIEYLTCVVF